MQDDGNQGHQILQAFGCMQPVRRQPKGYGDSAGDLIGN
jgi:hypothetical protein